MNALVFYTGMGPNSFIATTMKLMFRYNGMINLNLQVSSVDGDSGI